MTLSLWQLVYVITLATGPAKGPSGEALTYPHVYVQFEPPSDWLGCYNQKRIGLPLRQAQMLALNKSAKVTATCMKR